jgi:hypothetical protein
LPRRLVASTRLPIAGAELPVGLQLLAATDDQALGHAVGLVRTLGPTPA